MTLRISVHTIDPDTGKWVTVPLAEGKDLGGVEVWRYKVWSADIMFQLGLTLITEFWHNDWLVLKTDEELDQLAEEARIIQQHVEEIARQTINDPQAISFRAQNLIDAVALARQVGGFVTFG